MLVLSSVAAGAQQASLPQPVFASAPVPSPIAEARLDPAADLPPPTTASLPDAPSAASSAPSNLLERAANNTADSYAAPHIDSPREMLILPGEIAPKQTARDKLLGSLRESVYPTAFLGEAVSAGYSHLRNGSPNYGTNSTAYAQRFGAAVARGTSQKLFSDGAAAVIFHEDPRYYVLGPSHPFVKRLFSAATRPLITRTDGGRATPNLALLTGYFGAAALTQVYYPQPNQGFSQTLQTYGGSIGGAALSFVVAEFYPDALEILHLKKP